MKKAIPASSPIGIGFRQPHYGELLETLPPIDFLEVHSENFFAAGGASPAVLAQARSHYPISLHGVGLGLGSAIGLDDWHVAQLKQLVERIDPFIVSDHACFARAQYPYDKPLGVVHGSDLLPIRFTHASLEVLCANVAQVQDALQRRIAVENLSAYVHWAQADYSETDFLNTLARRTGCGLLLDVNNIYVNACNTMTNATEAERIAAAGAFIKAIDASAVLEIHLAGCTPTDGLRIDDHACAVQAPVWQLYEIALQRFAGVPTLIEWDLNLPPLAELLHQANMAKNIANPSLRNTVEHADAR